MVNLSNGGAELNSLFLSFTRHAAALFPLLLLALLFSIYVYRRTNPVVSLSARVALTVLRTISLLLLLFVIYETTLHFRHRKSQPPILAIALDNTASMTITDNKGSRHKILRDVLQSAPLAELERKYDVVFYSFSSRIEPYQPNQGDSLSFAGDVTNIRAALELIKAQHAMQNLTDMLFISDGSYNDGGNPVRDAEGLGIPVHTIAIGSSDPVTDLAIAGADANPFAYIDQATPVQVTVRNTGFAKMAVPVELRQDGVVFSRETVQLPPSPSETTATLPFTPRQVGRLKVDLTVPQQVGERIIDNNSRTLYINVLKSKLKMLLIAGAVTPDISFMKSILQNDRYEIESYVHKSKGEFYQRPPSLEALQEIDIFIFYDYPIRGATPAFAQNLMASLSSKKQSVLFIPGANTSLPDAEKFVNFIPLQNAAMLQRERPVLAEPSAQGLNHPILRISADPILSKTVWKELPPVFATLIVHQVAQGSEVLAYARSDGQPDLLSPLIVARVNGSQKSAAIFAHQLWRWDFMMRGINRSDQIYTNLLQNTIRWLETDRSESLVRVNMDKTHYNYGDPITLDIDVFDENWNPVDKADVRVVLAQRGEEQEYATRAEGSGSYSAVLQAPPGDYAAKVTAEVDGHRLGEETVLFSVGEYSAELTDIPSQPAVLRNLSRVTGGQFMTADSLSALTAIQGSSMTTELTTEHELWNNKYILLLILLCLTSEWFIRKRTGMV